MCISTVASAAVIIEDCSSVCVLWNGQTLIDLADETVIIAGSITPLPGSETVRVFAREIVVDGPSGGAITVTGKGRSIELNASRTLLVTGDLISSNGNGTIIATAIDMVQIESANLESGGNMEINCTGSACPVNLVKTHLRANRIFVNANGDILWDGNRIETFGPRDIVKIESRGGSVRKSGAITVALRSGRIVALSGTGKVDAASEAAAFCETCQEPTPTTTPTVFTTATLPAEFSPTPAATDTPTPTTTPVATETPPPTTTPAITATPQETATPTVITTGTFPGEFSPTPVATLTPTATTTQTQPPLVTATATEMVTPTVTVTPTPTPTLSATLTPAATTPTVTSTQGATATSTPTPAPTATPDDCNDITGGVESMLTLRAAGDVNASCDRYLIARDISIVAGGSINLRNAEISNDFGKCGEIEIQAAGQVDIERAILVDDDCRNRPDVSEINGREQVPHTGFNNVIGTPLVDD